MKKTALATALILASASGIALAQQAVPVTPAKPAPAMAMQQHPPEHGPGDFLAQFDTNHDGKIDKAEFEAVITQRATARFNEIDKDGKGTITKDQFVKFSDAEATARFDKMDRNKDGVLSEADRPPRPDGAMHGKPNEIPPPPPAEK